MQQRLRSTIALMVSVLAVAACGAGGASGDGSSIAITNPRVRAVAPGMESTAIYLDVTNDGDTDDELLSASVPEDIAGTVELHETVVMEESGDIAGDDMASESAPAMDDMSEGGDLMDGMAGMAMQQVESIAVPAGETVSLEPGGLHIMLLDFPAPLAASEFEVTLEFAEAGSVTVPASVVDNP